ncbi:ABC transporter ATP-binding protein [Dyadobacter helix]|nr:ABC transporter ATP-binding protein [Dyadobacter sp. CECT 9275]
MPILQNLDLNLHPGQLVCLLGANGTGKSTLIRTLAGLQQPVSGEIFIGETNLKTIKPELLAKKLSVVLTEKPDHNNLTVRELVTIGRTPHTGWFGTLKKKDDEKIQYAMEMAGAGAFAARRLHELSDGERQKVMLARALAQDTDMILLDEPTAHLDIPNRVEMMYLLHALARKTNKAILLSTHELDLALQIADRLWLIDKAKQLTSGTPEDLVLNGTFGNAFTKIGLHFDPLKGTFGLQPPAYGLHIFVTGDPVPVHWTVHALSKENIGRSTEHTHRYSITVENKTGEFTWILKWNEVVTTHRSIESLVEEVKKMRTR